MDDIRPAIRDDATTANRRAEQAEQKTAALDRVLVELRISEQASADLAEYATGETTDLRKRLDAAEQRAGQERTCAERVEQQLTSVEAELVASRAEAAGLRCQLEQVRLNPPRTRRQRFKVWRRWPR